MVEGPLDQPEELDRLTLDTRDLRSSMLPRRYVNVTYFAPGLPVVLAVKRAFELR